MTSAPQDSYSWFVPSPPPGEDDLPFSDGEPVDSEKHGKQQTLLTSSIQRAWSQRDDFYVGGNMAVYYSQLQTKKNDFRGPDVFVVLDTNRRVRKSWVVWGEDGRTPDVVIELISPITEAVDRGDKMRIYEKLLRVSNYYLFDPITGVFEGYELDRYTRSYVRMTPTAGGDLPCPVLGLSLGVRQGLYQGVDASWLRWLDSEDHVLPTDEEAAREEARRRGDAEARATEEARQRQDAETRAAEEARQRQDAERRLADALAEIERIKRAGG
jgi:Uma2 family endonuclease